jgi:ketosteroid isomerase-like protein
VDTRFFTFCALCTLLGSCVKEPSREEAAARSAAEIRQLLGRWETAFERKDVDGVMSLYAPGNALTAYDIVAPLQVNGTDAYRKGYAQFFAEFDGPIGVEHRDEHVEVGDNVAIAYGLEHVTGTLKDGTSVDRWTRYTEGFRRIGDRWYVVHEHISVPVDFATGKARLDLVPGTQPQPKP